MKKTMLLPALACFAAFALQADDLKINGDFKILNKNKTFPAFWLSNFALGKKMAAKLVPGDKPGTNFVNIVNETGMSAIYSQRAIKAKAGDVFEFKAEAKGSGTLTLGYYSYDAGNRFLTGASKKFNLKDGADFTEFGGKITVADRIDKSGQVTGKTEAIRIVVGTLGKTDVTIKEIEVEPESKK